MGGMHRKEYYSAIKRNWTGSFVEMWMDLEIVVHCEVKSEREKQILCVNTSMWNLEKWYRWTYLQGKIKDTDVENMWTQQGKGRMGWSEKVALTYVLYHV